MNTPTATPPSPNRNHDNVAASPARRERRARQFGAGYGSSSGYASGRRYVNDWGLTRFRFA